MSRSATRKNMKQVVVQGVLATALAAFVGFLSPGISAAGTSRLWSVVIHIEYDNGFVYEHAFATGVPISTLPSILEACGSSHQFGSVVRYHCYPTPE